MDDITIPKDFKDYEPKLIAGLTIRQTLLIVPAFIIAILAKSYLPETLFLLLVGLIFSIVWLFGWTKPYNMKFEKFLASSFVKMFLSPQQRIYKTDNLHRVILEKSQEREEKDIKDSKDRKNRRKKDVQKERK